MFYKERTIIKLEGVTKVFNVKSQKVTAIEKLNLSIYDGEFLCIVGPSGCGKTTLLRILAGLEQQTSGRVIISPREPEKPLNSMVFQGDSLFPWMTVKQNVAYGLKMRGVAPKDYEKVVAHYINMMGLSKFENAYPHQLSGGMRQRVSVARAFANDPEILLLDEPFGALDEQNRILLQQELLKIWEGTFKTAVFITHSIDEALILGDRVLVMTAHPGRLKAEIKIDLPRPRDTLSMRANKRFVELYEQIWSYLKEEVIKAKSAV
ncbi:MAG: NitT/TauT family transport system ATP-binding protein [Thermosediminibacterales bacterium]|nr:NitT/TauT family transport system ATP-binding protein [Thermosediminibacterales bacterium]MDK2835742.1 NitT/TauT family transport system ATP-binding protein [Thermosediminibacterales bacterium]